MMASASKKSVSLIVLLPQQRFPPSPAIQLSKPRQVRSLKPRCEGPQSRGDAQPPTNGHCKLSNKTPGCIGCRCIDCYRTGMLL